MKIAIPDWDLLSNQHQMKYIEIVLELRPDFSIEEATAAAEKYYEINVLKKDNSV